MPESCSDPFKIEIAKEIEYCIPPVFYADGTRYCDESLAHHICDMREGSVKEKKGLE